VKVKSGNGLALGVLLNMREAADQQNEIRQGYFIDIERSV